MTTITIIGYLALCAMWAGFIILTIQYVRGIRSHPEPIRQDIFVCSCKSCFFTFSGPDQFEVFKDYSEHYGKAHQ